jgi:hypothetical protein
VRAANTRRGVQARNSQLSSLRERQINSPHGAGRRPNKEDHARARAACLSYNPARQLYVIKIVAVRTKFDFTAGPVWRSAVDRVMAVGRVACGGARKFAACDTAGWSRTAIRPSSISQSLSFPMCIIRSIRRRRATGCGEGWKCVCACLARLTLWRRRESS